MHHFLYVCSRAASWLVHRCHCPPDLAWFGPAHPEQDSSQGAISWLESAGVNLSGVVQLGGHTKKRTHHNPSGPNVGFAIMKALHDKQSQTPSIRLITSAQARGRPGQRSHCLLG